MKELAEVTVKIIRETEAAYLVTSDDKDRTWLPKSQIEDEVEGPDGTYIFTIPQWLAEDKLLV